MKSVKKLKRGFSLIETLIAIGVFLTVVVIISPNSFNLISTSASTNALYTLITDLRNQQIKAMVGDTEGRGTPDTYGVYIQSSQYTLFHGQNYSVADSSNFAIPIGTGYQLTTTFGSGKIVFASGSGEIVGFVSNQNSITVSDTRNGGQKTIQLNKYGIITSIN